MTDGAETPASAFGSFWLGPLNGFAYACLASFPRAGATLSLYSYDLALKPPAGVSLLDARAVCPDETLVRRFIVDGKPSVAAFADMFRYRMIKETGLCWVDADLLCLARPTFAGEPYIFCRQADAVSTLLVNNAVLRLPKSEPALAELLTTAESAADVDQKWGALGPFLLTPVLERHGLYAKAMDPHICYPIEPEQFWKLFLPERKREVEQAVARSTFVHLWSEAIRWSRHDFSIGPPRGSYLYEHFAENGALPLFSHLSDEAEVRALMASDIAKSEAEAQRRESKADAKA